MKKTTSVFALALTIASVEATAQTSDVLTVGTIFKRVVSDTTVMTTNSETYATLASTQMFIPPGVDALVTARFSAESRCTEPSSSSPNWCAVRILIDGVEANPVETSSTGDFAFDSTDSGNATVGNYQAHSMDRHLCVNNQGSTTYRVVSVDVEWKVTNLDAGSAPSFWIDDSTLTVEASNGCFKL